MCDCICAFGCVMPPSVVTVANACKCCKLANAAKEHMSVSVGIYLCLYVCMYVCVSVACIVCLCVCLYV